MIHILARSVDSCQQLFLKHRIFFLQEGYNPTKIFFYKARVFARNGDFMKKKKEPLNQTKQELLREIDEMTAIQYKYKYLLRRMRQFEGDNMPIRSMR